MRPDKLPEFKRLTDELKDAQDRLDAALAKKREGNSEEQAARQDVDLLKEALLQLERS
jgi:hypothetical protein